MFILMSYSLTEFTGVSAPELHRLILASPPKSSELDPLLPFLIQESIDSLLPFLTLLCNASLREGVLPSSQKRSIIMPVIKQSGFDPTAPSSYRPIANVTFMSKIVEKLVASQLFRYLDSNNLILSSQNRAFARVIQLNPFSFACSLTFMVPLTSHSLLF